MEPRIPARRSNGRLHCAASRASSCCWRDLDAAERGLRKGKLHWVGHLAGGGARLQWAGQLAGEEWRRRRVLVAPPPAPQRGCSPSASSLSICSSSRVHSGGGFPHRAHIGGGGGAPVGCASLCLLPSPRRQYPFPSILAGRQALAWGPRTRGGGLAGARTGASRLPAQSPVVAARVREFCQCQVCRALLCVLGEIPAGGERAPSILTHREGSVAPPCTNR
nr:unnamed protein product [Digitaria exilis]